MLRNVRMSCCVAGNCHLQASGEDVKETLELLAARLQLPPGLPCSLVKDFSTWQRFCSMWHHHFTSRPSVGLQTAKCPCQSGLLMTQNRATGPLLDVHPGSPCTFRSSPTDLGPSWQPNFGWAGQHVPSLLQGRPMSEMGP